MNQPATSTPRGNLRPRLASQAAVVTFAVVTICVLGALLASLAPLRFDLTATREHRLAPQTAAIVAKLNRPLDLVVAAELSAMDTVTRRRTLDVVEKFGLASPNIRPTLIDTASPDGLRKFDAFLTDLAVKTKPAIDAATAGVTAVAQSAEATAAYLDETARTLEALRDSVVQSTLPAAQRDQVAGYWNTQASAARTLAEDTRQAAAKAREVLNKVAPPLPIPAIDESARILRGPVSTLATGLTVLSRAVEQFILDASSVGRPRDLARELAASLPSHRDIAARAVTQLDTLPQVPLLSIAKAVQRSRAVLLISPDDAAVTTPASSSRRAIIALNTDAIFPSAATEGAAADDRFRAEQLIAAGIASMISSSRPLVVLVHGAPAKAGPAYKGVRTLVDALSLRGIDVAEWAAGIDAEPPAIVEPDPAHPRPVVYLNLGIDVRSPDDATRMSKLASALTRLVAAGKNVLLSVNRSTLPGAGAQDPLVECLRPLGLAADSGRTLYEETRPMGTAGRDVLFDQIITDPLTEHPVSAAVSGLRLRLPLISPLEIAAASASPGAESAPKVTPLIRLAARPALWAEADWNIRQGLPAKDSARDLARDKPGDPPWVIGAAIERRFDPKTTQRVIVIGSALWVVDSVLAKEGATVDGRRILDAPGNAELACESVAWLAGLDDSIARSAAAQSVPTIPNLSGPQRSALQWLFVGIIPVGILLLGVLWRWLWG